MITIDYPSVFSIFFFVLKRLGRDTWSGEAPELPLTIFDAIKDNPEYIRLLTSSADSASSRPALSWMSTYLDHIVDDTVHAKVLAHVIDFLFEGLQGDQFGDVRQSAMLSATQASIAVRSSCSLTNRPVVNASFVEILFATAISAVPSSFTFNRKPLSSTGLDCLLSYI
jgi:hypothetical protein